MEPLQDFLALVVVPCVAHSSWLTLSKVIGSFEMTYIPSITQTNNVYWRGPIRSFLWRLAINKQTVSLAGYKRPALLASSPMCIFNLSSHVDAIPHARRGVYTVGLMVSRDLPYLRPAHCSPTICDYPRRQCGALRCLMP
jgi:hypothetical protein